VIDDGEGKNGRAPDGRQRPAVADERAVPGADTPRASGAKTPGVHGGDLSDDLLEDGSLTVDDISGDDFSSDDFSADDFSSDDEGFSGEEREDLSGELTEVEEEEELDLVPFPSAPSSTSHSEDDDDELDPFSGPATLDSLPPTPLVNPFAYPATPQARTEGPSNDLNGSSDPASFRGHADDSNDSAIAIVGSHDEGDGVSLDEPVDEVAWLRREVDRAKTERQIDELLSLLDRLLRHLPDDEAVIEQYEAALAGVIHDYFPGATPESIPILTVETWELPDLVRDPVMGAILGRMDGITALRDLYSALPDLEPGTVYRLVSRAKGKGLIRFENPE